MTPDPRLMGERITVYDLQVIEKLSGPFDSMHYCHQNIMIQFDTREIFGYKSNDTTRNTFLTMFWCFVAGSSHDHQPVLHGRFFAYFRSFVFRFLYRDRSQQDVFTITFEIFSSTVKHWSLEVKLSYCALVSISLSLSSLCLKHKRWCVLIFHWCYNEWFTSNGAKRSVPLSNRDLNGDRLICNCR